MPDQAAAAPADLAQLTVHNLKTPLTSMLATLELLAEGDLGPLSAPHHEAVRGMQARGEELLDLIEDLLQLWRLEAESIDLSLEPIDPGDLATEVYREWAAVFERARARVHVQLTPGVPAVHGDRFVLRRALGNLLHNALVHAGERVTVHLTVDADGEFVCFSVSDDGVGIPPEFHEMIFEKFGRVPGPRPVRGTGLGLPYCRLAAEAHRGDLRLESEPGQGAAFRLRIPTGSEPGAVARA